MYFPLEPKHKKYKYNRDNYPVHISTITDLILSLILMKIFIIFFKIKSQYQIKTFVKNKQEKDTIYVNSEMQTFQDGH